MSIVANYPFLWNEQRIYDDPSFKTIILMDVYNKKGYEELKRIRGESEKIDYGCQKCFDPKRAQYNEKRCCSGCAINFGYLRVIRIEDWQYYRSKFNKLNGFWRKDKGCILPRNMRSHICLSHTCRYSEEIANYCEKIWNAQEKAFGKRDY